MTNGTEISREPHEVFLCYIYLSLEISGKAIDWNETRSIRFEQLRSFLHFERKIAPSLSFVYRHVNNHDRHTSSSELLLGQVKHA